MNNAAHGQMAVGLDKDSLRQALATQRSDTARIATLILLGQQYFSTQPDTAIVYYQQALQLARAFGDVNAQALVWQGLAQGQYLKGNYAAAERLLLGRALPFATRHGQREVHRSLLLLLSDVEIALGRPRQALEYRRRYDSLSQSLAQKEKQAMRQRVWLVIAVAGVLLLGALFVGIWSYYRQRQLLRAREAEVLQVRQENVRLRATLEGLVGERQRISKEMHDDVGSGLTSLLFMSRTPGVGADGGDAGDGSGAGGDGAGGGAGGDAAGDHATIIRMQQTAEQLIRKMNEIVWTLSHDQDSLESLVAYIRSNAAEMLGQAGIDVRFNIDEDLPEKALTQEFRRNVYLVVKEAVHNIVRHSGASVAEIGVHLNGWELTVVVQDNGKGIYKAGGNRWGNGMKNMQRRVEQVGGRMEITAGGGRLLR
ncbi:ATP-binding protein [Puia sp. P3]|uniref:ATP-binding protein n=1 Tax=Puia sp. P3 TaxID=3423952 RepID=UPI003D667455